jgi:hypothetical protein
MLCYAMLCYAMLCYAMLCYAMLCYAVLCYAMLSYAMLCYARTCPGHRPCSCAQVILLFFDPDKPGTTGETYCSIASYCSIS